METTSDEDSSSVAATAALPQQQQQKDDSQVAAPHVVVDIVAAKEPHSDKEEEEEEESLSSEEEEFENENDATIITATTSSSTNLTSLLQHQQEQERIISLQLAQEEAYELRQKGKHLHDEGQWSEAADTFFQASQLLRPYIDTTSNNLNENVVTTTPVLLEDYATCRLHEALCRWKQKDHAQCIAVCTLLLEDGRMSAAIRARALYRRAKAKHEEENVEGALEDARSAAFLGDRKAVALYGTLLRESGGQDLMMEGEEASTTMVQDLLLGKNPFAAAAAAAAASGENNNGASAALLESLLSKSGPTTNNSGDSPLQSMLMAGMGNNGGGGGGGGGMAKAVLSSLSKRLEKEESQATICQYLQKTSTAQIQQLAAMAGVPLSQDTASRVVDFCHGVTPRGIQRSLRTTRAVWYAASLLRKVARLLSKYRQVLILWVLVSWIKSAVLRPSPINKRAARRAMRQALAQGGTV